jgi:hypothetical protein
MPTETSQRLDLETGFEASICVYGKMNNSERTELITVATQLFRSSIVIKHSKQKCRILRTPGLFHISHVCYNSNSKHSFSLKLQTFWTFFFHCIIAI